MHLKETWKFSISAASGKQAPTDITNGFTSTSASAPACACVGRAWYGNISGHIMHFIAIEKYVSRVKI